MLKTHLKKKVVEAFDDPLDSSAKRIQRGYRIVKDSTGKFQIGKTYGLDLLEKVKDLGWISWQHEGGNFILHKTSNVDGKRIDQQLELELV
jgi:hypothetical protein